MSFFAQYFLAASHLALVTTPFSYLIKIAFSLTFGVNALGGFNCLDGLSSMINSFTVDLGAPLPKSLDNIGATCRLMETHRV